MADAGDSKSPALRGVWVQLPPPAPTRARRWVPAIALLASLSALSGASTSREPTLEEILGRLGEAGEGYVGHALGFSCVELLQCPGLSPSPAGLSPSTT